MGFLMILKVKLYLFVFIFNTSVAYCQNDSKREVILVTAKASKSKLVDSDNENDSKAVFYPMTFNITFKDIHVELGKSAEYPSKATFEIKTRSDYMIMNAERVSLLIDVTEPNNHKLLDLDFISSVTCFNQDYLDDSYSDIYFHISFDNMKSKKCIILTGEYLSPNR